MYDDKENNNNCCMINQSAVHPNKRFNKIFKKPSVSRCDARSNTKVPGDTPRISFFLQMGKNYTTLDIFKKISYGYDFLTK